MKDTLAKRLADFVYDLSYDDLPAEVVEKTKISILDAMACAFDGHLSETSKLALTVWRTLKGSGKATIWLNGEKGHFIDTAWANCLLIHSMLHDDTQWSAGGHMGSIVIPTAFAIAEEEDKSGTEVLTAMVAGYEVASRIGMKSSQAIIDRGFRGSGIFGTFAAVVAGGKLMGLDGGALKHAINCASTFSAGTLEASNLGTAEWRFQNGAALRNGILAALLAKEGLKAAETALEGKYGFFHAFGGRKLRSKIIDEMDSITESLGKEFEVSGNMFKPFATCGCNQVGTDIAVALAKRNEIKVEDIQQVRVKVNPANKRYPGIKRRGPFETIDQALLSKSFSIAAAVKNRDLQTKEYLTLLEDPEILAFAKKVIIEVDEAMDVMDSRVEFVLKDGRSIKGDQSSIDMSRYRLNRKMAMEKFKGMSSTVLSEVSSSRVGKSILELERISNISEITSLLARSR
jgi:2-methylcitrate dehydratase PrpD